MHIDAKLRHPNIGSSENWKDIFQKIIEKTQSSRDLFVKYLLRRIHIADYGTNYKRTTLPQMSNKYVFLLQMRNLPLH